jgi:signal transduction histidine kinase
LDKSAAYCGVSFSGGRVNWALPVNDRRSCPWNFVTQSKMMNSSGNTTATNLLRKQQVISLNILLTAAVTLLATMRASDLKFGIGILPPARESRAILRQVFVNLLISAIKFSRNSENPVIQARDNVTSRCRKQSLSANNSIRGKTTHVQ